MRIFTVLLAIFAFWLIGVAHAQDPGGRDSVIIDSISVDYLPQGGTCFVHVWFVTDDSIVWVNLPITWTSQDGNIFPGHTVWREIFTQWDDCYDSLLLAQMLLRQIAFSDIGGEDNPPLLTDGQRLWGMDLRFVILPGATRGQFVRIDTTTDPINGPIDFGGPHGWYSFMPAFKNGFLLYDWPVGIGDNMSNMPDKFDLQQNYPNPFNAETVIKFQLPVASDVAIDIYNLLGQKVVTLAAERRQAGFHAVHWNGVDDSGRAVPSGIYFCRMTAGDFVGILSLVVLR